MTDETAKSPMDALVDGILDRAVREGVFDGMPSLRDVIGAHGTAAPGEAHAARVRASVVVLSDLIRAAHAEMAALRGPLSRAAKAREIADLRHRLACEVQAMRPGGRHHAPHVPRTPPPGPAEIRR